MSKRQIGQKNLGRSASALLDFARMWQVADEIIYSKSLETVSTPKTRLEREFEPQVVRDLKAQLPHGASVGGPTLAAQAIRSGLVGAATWRPSCVSGVFSIAGH